MPSGVFKPYAGVSTTILLFTKTNSGGTENVWFYDMQADGFSLDDKRTEQETSDLPDILQRWQNRDAEVLAPAPSNPSSPQGRDRRKQYDLSINATRKSCTRKSSTIRRRGPRDLRQLEATSAKASKTGGDGLVSGRHALRHVGSKAM